MKKAQKEGVAENKVQRELQRRKFKNYIANTTCVNGITEMSCMYTNFIQFLARKEIETHVNL